MNWFDVTLSEDERDVIDLVSAIVNSLGDLTDDSLDAVNDRRRALAEAGLWTLGVPEEFGGGGGSLRLRQVMLAALGRHWPAMAWASAQAHAAAELLGGRPEWATLLDNLHSGKQAVCVVDGGSASVDLGDSEQVAVGRLDPAGSDPAVLVLRTATSALVLDAGTLQVGANVRRSGLAGALTTSASATAPISVVETTVSTTDVRSRLHLAGAAIAAGITAECAEKASAYSRSRVQFGSPLTALPTVRQSILRQAGAARTALLRALTTPPTQFVAATALHDNCELAIETGAAAVQSHGGYGYLTEYGIERLVRDSISLRAATDAAHAVRAAAAALVGADSASIDALASPEGRRAS
ncbi:acyl-CoA dehydrogenase family protein [Rhodococcus opacus]|uniref:acyl-CoA dehydrogenase family protein n=1 Tax=Rhodococcus opacus TaxID=37919 RepID=UPI001C475A83|nr:acyl-CoA dehydrogenase family protein [Rhodococcus opacus]MBV6756674.1 acyl-CoA/acyl-ACP dehydrogenase [Rhodococcus opacus]